MELRQLRYFVAVAEIRSFSRAAEQCRVSQPSLSQQIIKLEQELGQPLFDRLGRRVLLTEAGTALLPKARSVLASFDEIERHLSRDLEEGAGQLSIGAIPTIAPYLLPKPLAAFRKTHPSARVTLHEALTEDLIGKLIEGEIDAAIMSLPIDNDLIEHEVLFEEPLLACLPASHPLAKKKSIRTSQLLDEQAIVLHSMHCLGRQTQAFCMQKRLERTTSCYSMQLATVQEMVATGLGYSLIPEMCARLDKGRGRAYLPVQDGRPARAIVAAWRTGRALPRLTQAFLDLLRSPA